MRLTSAIVAAIALALLSCFTPAAASTGQPEGTLDLRTVVTILSTLLTLFIGFYARNLENKVEAKMDKALADAMLRQFDSSYKVFAASVREGNERTTAALTQMQQLELKMVRENLSRESVRDIVAAELQPLRMELVKLTQQLSNLTQQD